jgi:hypothetical protein
MGKRNNIGGKRDKWATTHTIAAVDEVRNKEMSIGQGSVFSCLYRLMKVNEGERIKLAPDISTRTFRRTFSDEQEGELIAHIKDLDCRLMPLTKRELGKLAFDFAENLRLAHRFNQQTRTAETNFYYEFMAGHPDLSLRCAEIIYSH